MWDYVCHATDSRPAELRRPLVNSFVEHAVPTPIIECQLLKKHYGATEVLHSVDFRIQPGRLVGFLGPNGAGKTTTIRILLGLLKPSEGSASIFDRDCQRFGKQIRQQIGYLPGDVHFYPNLTGFRTLKFLADARFRNCREEILRLATIFELDLHKRVRKYSTGMRQKLGLIQAFMHKPQLLILDEPTSALDPLIRKVVFQELQNVVRQGRTILFSSHSLSEVEELCDEVIILRSGRIVEQQDIEALKNNALRRVRLFYASEQETPQQCPSQFNVLNRNSRMIVGTWTGSSQDLIRWLATQQINDLMIEKPDLNDLFLTYYQEPGKPT